jgi:flagellar M-ring protein FliF
VPAGLTLVALAVLFGVVRPALMTALAPPVDLEAEAAAAAAAEAKAKGGQLDAVVEDLNELPLDAMPGLLEAPAMNKKLEQARLLAKENPTAVANIVRDWVNGESAA